MSRRTTPPPASLLEKAGRLLEDGASQLEVIRTTGIARETLVKHFPGKGWTYKQGGKFRALTRDTKPLQAGRPI
jgi:hypothetical protein